MRYTIQPPNRPAENAGYTANQAIDAARTEAAGTVVIARTGATYALAAFEAAYDATYAEAARLSRSRSGSPRFAAVHAKLMRSVLA